MQAAGGPGQRSGSGPPAVSGAGPGSSFRPLLPRPPPPSSGAGRSAASHGVDRGSPGTQLLPPRKSHTRIACESCRRRKIKCDGKRPACSGCITNGGTCTYLSTDPNESRSSAIKRKFGEVQERVSSHEELYMMLKSRSRPEVTEILRRIRAGIDVEAILRYVKDGDLLLQLHLAPETRLRYTFPEFASWPTLFRDPADPYLKTPLLDFDGASRLQADRSQAIANRTPSPHWHVYQMPYHAAHMVDPRLASVRAATWTSVTTDDALVSRLLAIYFQYEYPRTRVFQKDLFLDDLVRGRTTFCSSLLVNCILANAAHGLTNDPHRVEFWTPRSLPYAFLAEAKRLWDIEIASEPKLTMIHAAVSLCLRYGADGADKIGLPFLLKALELAEKMELFTRPEEGDARMRRARTFTAWSLFSYHSLTFYYLNRAPFLVKPPATPLPDYGSVHELAGEIHLKYPLQPALTPIHLGATFRAQVELYCIMLEINNAARRAGTPGTAAPTLRKAVEFYKRLDAWFKGLPRELQPSWIVMPHDFQIHMEYCLVLINLLEPWLNGPDASHQIDGHTIQEIGTVARARLETLIRLYYLRHSFDALDVMLIMFLLLLGSISIRVLTSGEDNSTQSSNAGQQRATSRRDASTFLLCAKGLHDQGQNQYLGSLMFNMLSGLVDPSNEALVSDLAKIRAEFRGTEVKPEYVHMDWPVYTWVHPQNQSMGRLLEAVDELSVDDDEEEGEGRS